MVDFIFLWNDRKCTTIPSLLSGNVCTVVIKFEIRRSSHPGYSAEIEVSPGDFFYKLMFYIGNSKITVKTLTLVLLGCRLAIFLL